MIDINADLQALGTRFENEGVENPMRLRVYVKDEQHIYRDPDQLWGLDDKDMDFILEYKTLTQAELAAEYWKSRLQVASAGNRDMAEHGHLCEHWEEKHRQLDILSRFATNPDYTKDLDED